MKKLYRPQQIEIVLNKCKQKQFYVDNGNTRNRKYYTNLYCGFDIETTTLENHNAYMYIWQFSINDYIIIGRTWDEFIEMLQIIKQNILPNKYSNKKNRVIIWVANLSFEFQFMRKHLNITEIFAKEERQPLLVVDEEVIEFRDCIAISGGNLEYLAKNYTKTKKLVGELNYSKIRNNKTPLTLTETKYIINDVKILSEWSKYIFDTYIIKHQLPFTKTGIIRNEIKSKINNHIKEQIQLIYPDEKMYNFCMKYLFRGGYTHSNAYFTNTILTDIHAFDFKSSYPYCMIGFNYPMSVFKKIDIKSESEIEHFSDFNKYCYMFIAEFSELTATSEHSLESVSKCIELSDNHFSDNGRLRYAEKVTVMLTNYDYEIYKLLYKWNEIKVIKFWFGYVKPLPEYLISTLLKYYQKKEILSDEGKKNSPEYTLSKENVNSHYGMCVTRLINEEIKYIDDEWTTEKDTRTFKQKIKNQFLSPYWGIWITSIARYNLLQFFDKNKIGRDIVYSDTDSIYIRNYGQHKHIIDDYNKMVIAKNIDFFSGRPEKFPNAEKIGTFEDEGGYIKFKTLGAKRYICTNEKNEHKVTIAGLPKKSLQKYCEKNNKDIYTVFTDDMFLSIEFASKNAHSYNDESHEDIVDGVKMCELSSCGIYPITFNLKIADLYGLYLMECFEKRRKNGE